jgi:hypothetical protein
MEATRLMDHLESENPDGKSGELSPDAPNQPSDKGAKFPEFAKLEGEEEFETVDYRQCSSDSYVDLETTYLTKRIWERRRLTLVNWRQLSELEAATLAQFNGELVIWLEDTVGPELQMHLCRVLAEHRNMLVLIGFAKLTEDAATALLQHPGSIVMDLKLDFHTAYVLSTRFDIQIIPNWWEPEIFEN